VSSMSKVAGYRGIALVVFAVRISPVSARINSLWQLDHPIYCGHFNFLAK